MKVLILTKDRGLKDEVEGKLPKGFRLSAKQGGKGDIILVDIDTISNIRDFTGDSFTVAVTKQDRTELVMEATASGAYEVIQRPIKKDVLSRIIEEIAFLKEELLHTIPISPLPPTPTCAIVGSSEVIIDLCKKIARLAQSEVPVLITGETGTGKELIAEAIAQLSARFGRPFVVVNCAAVPESLLESELFGYEKGAFTGAGAPKEGILKIAHEGCVFFDEVGELPLSIQGKLLRFLQTQTFYPVGGTKEIQVDVRILSATNKDLALMVREGKFREDLYHRLRVATIHAPSLRERKGDIPLLVNFFVHRYRNVTFRPVKGFTKAFLERLMSYDWPGNIRELENTIRSAIALRKTDYLTTFELKELGSPSLYTRRIPFVESLASVINPVLKEAIERGEEEIYQKLHDTFDRVIFNYTLSLTGENQSEAARKLGISRLTLRKKLRLGLSR